MYCKCTTRSERSQVFTTASVHTSVHHKCSHQCSPRMFTLVFMTSVHHKCSPMFTNLCTCTSHFGLSWFLIRQCIDKLTLGDDLVVNLIFIGSGIILLKT
ncbi:hypothetical protein EGW08_019756 [Elysia chlorotica]|uniref:Uncharacterized protein n=1 Tax=Elysia chlorotica TaxID=188477 RepID=A0A3S1BQK2_ELYCH|nr:hypothetical protein EGW08_019756 [Elysia chlorotica]